MDDYLLFLGTAGDHHVLTHNPASHGILFCLDGKLFIADPGPGCFLKAIQYTINPAEVYGILLTHNHLLHVNDANVFITAMTKGCTDKKGHLFGAKSFFAKGGRKHNYLPPFHRNHIRYAHSMKAGDKSRMGKVEVKATPVQHPDGGIGFKITTPWQVISYVGDTSYAERVVKAHAGCTILILNCKNPLNIEEKGQLNTTDAHKFIAKVKPQIAFLSHIGHKLLDLMTPIDLARELQKKTGVHVVAAKEGVRTNLFQYMTKNRQKTLEGY